ncbi:ABC transporter ATP-binding protein [Methanosarcina sp. WWM596]|uniref:ABC transporter ATP-binding protein n=1 Tax=Methanosarcina sp. WWM596 TaxID=1434103 RepID=UPI000615E090|nr:ABC transporter ATP-binding protein [Methanosarcina sp. WWM596]AKB17664.1 Vitamin B12 ABC transporter, ATPase component BtuD [Methanosarcina sp. WWM596]
MLELKNLSFGYKEKKTLKNINMSVNSGEVVGIIGPNGSGKSTLLKYMNLILEPEGRIFLEGVELQTLNLKEISKIIGYVPQNIQVSSFPIKVFDVVLLGRRPYIRWNIGEKDLDLVSEIFSLLNLDDLSMRNFNELSGGERQKILLARALAQEPKVLLLDEPTSSLDVKHQLEIMDIIRNLSREKVLAVVIVLHDLNLASRYCDRLILLNSGQIFAMGTPEEILIDSNIKTVYKVDSEISYSKKTGSITVLPISSY